MSETTIANAPIAWTSTAALSQPVFVAAGGRLGAALSLRKDAGGRLDVLGGRLGVRGMSHHIPLG